VTSGAGPSRTVRVLEHLAGHPGLTAGELGRALGLPGQLYEVLYRMETRALVVRTTGWSASQGREVSCWRVAPPGTIPSPGRLADPEPDTVRRRRERDRLSQRARRARARGLAVVPDIAPPLLRPAVPYLPAAACRTADPDLFFGTDGEDPAERQARERKAAAICAQCPARAACYAAAVHRGERWGTWGGVNFENRKKGRRAS
jgi:WhiB family redox-sensing transcriptional regulator